MESNCWKSECLSGRCDGVNHVMLPDLDIVQAREDGSSISPRNGAEYAVRMQAIRDFRANWDPSLQMHTFDEQYADWVIGRFRKGDVIRPDYMIRSWKRLVGLLQNHHNEGERNDD